MVQPVKRKYDLLKMLERYISACKSGKRLQKNGKRISKGSIKNFYFLQRHLVRFSEKRHSHLHLASLTRITKRELKAEQKYWKRFYHEFTKYLYADLGLYDNYVGFTIKLLRTFFNWLNDELELNIGSFHKKFYVVKEEIQIVVLSTERLNFLIYDKEFEEALSERLKQVKDIFVFGCTVALRVSDLMNLKNHNLERINDRVYLTINSKKTQAFTRIKLPLYAIAILSKHKIKQDYILPRLHNVFLNKYIKELMEIAGWTETFIKTRTIRGIPVVLHRDDKMKDQYRFCDMVTSHTMRRTAITNMLCLGMNEQMVRKISGHAPGSKEFFRYVAYSQTYIDKEMDIMYEKLKQRKLTPVENSSFRQV